MDDSEATPTPSPAADQAAIDVAHLIKVACEVAARAEPHIMGSKKFEAQEHPSGMSEQ